MPASTTSWWRRLVRWPTFAALAALHLLVLPLVLGEPGDRVLAVVAGLAYLGLALADRRWSPGGGPLAAESYSRRYGRYRTSEPA